MEDQVGSIEPGKRADIVLASPGHLDMQPVYDPVFTAMERFESAVGAR
jgi:cytosine/adenosine deaminase-related metal-dependent hydrolase